MTESDRPASPASPVNPVSPVSPDAPRAPRFLAGAAQAALVVAACAEVFRAVTMRAHDLDPAGTPSSRTGVASMVSLYAITLTATVFLMWFHRCRRNARLISPGADLGSDAWAVFAWLIPGVNLWTPRGLLLGTQRASSGGRTETGRTAEGRDDVLVNAWWVAWVAHVVIAMIGRSSTSLPLLVVTQAFDITAAALAICVVRRITSLQSGTPDTTRAVLQGT